MLHLADREKNTQQATITQLFQRRHAKDAANANLNKEPTIPKTTISISPITTTTALIIPTTLLKLKGVNEEIENMSHEGPGMERSNASLSQEDWSWVDYNLDSNETKARCPPPNKAKLELDLRKPLEEQDSITKLNHLATKKRKNVDDLHDYFKSTK
ncbi:hypothetical protein Tco_1372013, partial [Tanacetum coccineum]